MFSSIAKTSKLMKNKKDTKLKTFITFIVSSPLNVTKNYKNFPNLYKWLKYVKLCIWAVPFIKMSNVRFAFYYTGIIERSKSDALIFGAIKTLLMLL